jgi:hypothetical protein
MSTRKRAPPLPSELPNSSTVKMVNFMLTFFSCRVRPEPRATQSWAKSAPGSTVAAKGLPLISLRAAHAGVGRARGVVGGRGRGRGRGREHVLVIEGHADGVLAGDDGAVGDQELALVCGIARDVVLHRRRLLLLLAVSALLLLLLLLPGEHHRERGWTRGEKSEHRHQRGGGSW